MAKKHYIDCISPIGTFKGEHVTEISDRDGNTGSGRGHTREESDRNAENNYDDNKRDR